jgi:tetratricopeptide (TPR) repeat protein
MVALCGETVMAMLKNRPGQVLAVAAAMLCFALLAVTARAAEDDSALRARALKFNEITGEDPIRGQILALIEDAPGTKKLLAVALKMANAMDQPLNINATYILGTAARGLKEFEASEKFYRLNAEQAKKLESGEQMSRAFLGLYALYTENKKFKEAEKLCQDFLEFAENKGDVALRGKEAEFLERMIVAIAKQGRIDEATKLANKFIQRYKGHWLAVEVLGMVQREAGDSEEAAKTYEKVLQSVQKEKGIKEEELKYYTRKYRYILSGIYMDLDNVDKAAEQLKALLADDPDNPTFNNDLGYIWADHDMNLDEAEKMVRKALDEDRKQRRKDPDLKPEEDKDNAAYLDSLAWVLFKRKKYAEAKPLLVQAVKDEEGKHIEIYDHLAEVHLALGEKADAIAAWKKGLEVAGTSKREQQRKQEVVKKLKTHE